MLFIFACALPPKLLFRLARRRYILRQNDQERRIILIPIPQPLLLSILRIDPCLRRCIVVLEIDLVKLGLGFTECMVGPGECGTLLAGVSDGLRQFVMMLYLSQEPFDVGCARVGFVVLLLGFVFVLLSCFGCVEPVLSCFFVLFFSNYGV